MGIGKYLASRSPVRAGLAVLAAGVLVSGCGAGDVELNGKIFDALGVSSATKGRAEDPKMASRNGLVVPPNTGSLPEPGSGGAPAGEGDLAFINDPDRKQKLDKADLERRQAEYCKVHYEQAKARGDASADDATGPAGPCRATFLSAVKKWTGTDSNADE